MQELSSIIVILFGLGGFVGAMICELYWRRRLGKWLTTEGVIVAEVETDGGIHPEIEFLRNGEKVRFLSHYGGPTPRIGRSVIVLYDSITGEAEEFNWSNRWFGTIVSIIFAAIFIWAGISTWPNGN